MNSQNLISPNDRVGNKRDSDASLELLISLMPKHGYHDIITYPKNSHEQTQLGIDLRFKYNDNNIDYYADHKSRSRKWGHKGLFVLEWKNNAGEIGSLFKCTQDYFILEGSKSFVFFNPQDLQQLFIQKVYSIQNPIISSSQEAFSLNGLPKLHTLMTRSNYNRWWDGKPNEDKFAWFTYQEVTHLIKRRIPIEV